MIIKSCCENIYLYTQMATIGWNLLYERSDMSPLGPDELELGNGRRDTCIIRYTEHCFVSMQPRVTNYSSVNTSCRCGKETSFWYKRYIILNKNNKCTTSEHNSTCFMNLIVLVWALIKLCELKYRVWHIYFQLWKNLRTDFHSVICYEKNADLSVSCFW